VSRDELLTSGGVAELTGFSREAVRRAAVAGELVAVLRLPGPYGRRVFTLGAVEDWVRGLPRRRHPWRRFAA
jgi:hypothetical protein